MDTSKDAEAIKQFVGKSFRVGLENHGLLPVDPRIEWVGMSGGLYGEHGVQINFDVVACDGKSLHYHERDIAKSMLTILSEADAYITANL